jgi:hypothetical protein
MARILGTEQCIGGYKYKYQPAGWRTTPLQQASTDAAAEATTSTTTDAGSILQAIASVVDPELTYLGAYRNVNMAIPANQTNYLVDLGFPARVFRLDTQLPITLRLNNTQADQIYLDYQTSPFDLPDIPAGLAFQQLYFTNASSQAIAVSIFAMG